MNRTDVEWRAALHTLQDACPSPPDALVVLGSGHAPLAEAVQDPREVPFSNLPGFPRTGVKGHEGRFVAGTIEGREVLLQSGRFHLYEGHPPDVVTAPIRLAAELGTRVVLLTNAAGGVHRRLSPGDLVLLEDQVNLQARSPLEGPVLDGEVRFPDMSEPFDRELARRAESTARDLGIPLARGVYGGVAGPNFETPAEVRMLATLGADLVGMSTVPEVIVARARGMRVLGLSLVTNRASGLGTEPLGHKEVLEVAARASGTLRRLMLGLIASLPVRDQPRSGMRAM